MPYLSFPSNAFIICVMLLIPAGCSDSRRSTVPFDSENGKHSAAGWMPAGHSAAARMIDDGSAGSRTTSSGIVNPRCAACHGDDLRGGISGISCTGCHLGGPALVHPQTWVLVYRDHKIHAGAHGISSCAARHCHGASLEGVSGSGPSCSSCHLGGADHVHPAAWSAAVADHKPYTNTNGTASCSIPVCHGTGLQGVQFSGPSCTGCHIGDASHIHPLDWDPVLKGHGSFASINGTASCANQYCHGASLAGTAGPGPSCTSCHLGGATHIHPTAWRTAVRDHGPYSVEQGTAACAVQYCHGSSLTGAPGYGPSCSSCHMGGPMNVHPAGWSLIYRDHGLSAASGGTSACANAACHGAALEGVSGSGPSCTSCHSMPYDALTVTCGACHRLPPDGAQSPNAAGSHTAHMAVIPGAGCDPCHSGASSYVGDHSNGADDISFLSTYSSRSGTATFNASNRTCSNISCHGGPRMQTQAQALTGASTIASTPDWYTGTIDVNTQCAPCHVYGTEAAYTEHNNYRTGQHRRHVYNFQIDCVRCHDTAKLAVTHFTSLNTPALSGQAKATLLDAVNYDSIRQQCSPSSNNVAGCHDPQDDPRDW